MGLSDKDLYRFGPFQLDAGERRLTRSGVPLALTPKAFDTLLALVENPGHGFDKDELLKRVWPDTFVEEATLAKNISTLRKLLGDGESGSRYIETIPKFGYRFVAEVQRGEFSTAPPPPPPPAELQPLAKAPPRRAWRPLAAAAAGVLLMVAALLAWKGLEQRASAPPGRVVLAVLPFRNLSGDESQEFFADGLTEEMIARLSSINPQRLAVIARTSAMKYKDSTLDVAGISRELGADYVLESSFRREGNRVRITAQLVQARDQTHLWAETYEREVGQILPLQRELAFTIARQIRVVLGPRAQSRGEAADPLDPEVHLLYLRGRYYWNKRTGDGLRRAVDYYQQALDRNPSYAPAWSGLAATYAVFNEYNLLPATESFPRAKAAALRALDIDPAQVEARAALALVRTQYEWDWAGAEREFRQAIEINPNYAVAHHWYGMLLVSVGRFDEARRELEQALQLDPLSASIPVAIGASYYHQRRYDEAIAQYRRVIEIQPRSAGLRFHLGRALVQKHMPAEAIEQFETGMKLTEHDGDASLAYGYAAAGRRQDALRVLNASSYYSPYYSAAVFAALGERDRAFAELQRAVEQKVGRVVYLDVEPMFDPLRNDPRFHQLCRTIGLR